MYVMWFHLQTQKRAPTNNYQHWQFISSKVDCNLKEEGLVLPWFMAQKAWGLAWLSSCPQKHKHVSHHGGWPLGRNLTAKRDGNDLQRFPPMYPFIQLVPYPKSSTASLNTNASCKPSVQTHESLGDILHSTIIECNGKIRRNRFALNL